MTDVPEMPETTASHLPGSGPSVAAYVVLMVIGGGLLLAIGTTAIAISRRPAAPEVVVEPPKVFVMDEQLAAMFTDVPAEVIDHLDDPTFDAGRFYCTRAIEILQTQHAAPGTRQRLVTGAALEELKSFRPAVSAWTDAVATLTAAGAENPVGAMSVAELNERLNMVYDLRELAHELHAATNRLEYAFSERLITAGLDSEVAIEEARSFARASKITDQLHVRQLQRTELDRIEAALDFARQKWDRWRHLKSDETPVYYNDRDTTDYDALLTDLEQTRMEIITAHRTMFGVTSESAAGP